MKIVKKTVKLVDNPNYQKGNRQKRKIPEVIYTDIDISYLFDTCISYDHYDGEFEQLKKKSFISGGFGQNVYSSQ